MTKNSQKNLIILTILGLGFFLNSQGYLSPNQEVAELTTASIITPEFKELVDQQSPTECDFQDEIDLKFNKLKADSTNYQVLYRATKEKYSAEKYAKCQIPKSKIDQYGLPTVDLNTLSQSPIVTNGELKKTTQSSQSFPKIDSTYYERAYGYIPEIPSPSGKIPKPE